MARVDREDWLEDFGFVMTRDSLQSLRSNLSFETFQGSKPLIGLWLVLVSAWAGALGALIVSNALWRSWWLVAAWPLLVVASWMLARRIVRAPAGGFVSFLNGHCLFWGILIGIVAAWGAQRAGAGWAYGIAGGLGFLVGVVHGNYEPDDLQKREAVSSIGYLTAPLGACLVAYAWRNWLPAPPGLGVVALGGAVAAAIFLIPWIWAFLANLRNGEGLVRLAKLLLHRDQTVGEAIPLLTAAMPMVDEAQPLFALRGLAHALTGDQANAEADWALAGETDAPLARGWLALRRNDPESAVAAFARAEAADKRNRHALLGLASVELVRSDGEAALATIERMRKKDQGALAFTYMAEAYLALNLPGDAREAATVAIEEIDSTHGRSFLARAEAYRLLGRIDQAAEDYNKALWAADEPDIDERARAGLAAIDRPVSEDEPEW